MKRPAQEADKIYAALFEGPIPGVTRERFDRASILLHEGCTRSELDEYHRVVERSRDLEAVEYAARIFGRPALLPKKFNLMVWLAGVDRVSYDLLVNRRDRLVYGKLAVVLAGIRSAWKLAIGTLDLWWARRGRV